MKIYDKSRTIKAPTREDRTTYTEYHYTEYRADGTARGAGWEDYDGERASAQIKTYEVWTWDGKTYNKGGKRCFEHRGRYRVYGTPSEMRTVYLRTLCQDPTPPAAVSIRKI